MIHLKVKSKGVRFTIPIPYAVLIIIISILSSKLVHQIANKWTKKHLERKKLDFTIPRIDKRMLQPIVKELRNYKGIELVDIKAEDGSEIRVRL